MLNPTEISLLMGVWYGYCGDRFLVIRKEENSRKTYCSITKEEFCDLFLEK